MKKLENKTTTMRKSETDFMTFADLCVMCVNNVPEGATISEMRNLQKVVDVCETGKLEFEDAVFSTLKTRVDAMKWGVVSKDIVEFGDAIDSAE